MYLLHFLFLAVALLLVRFAATGHPGVGLAEDSRGNVYYTDLVHVWKISPDGQKTIAVRNVHTHELALDAADNLFGEDLVYEGEALNRWHHRIWKRSPDGRVLDLFGKRDGFRNDHGFVRDRRGTEYWIYVENTTCLLRKRTPDGRVSTIQPKSPLPRLSWLALGEDDSTLYATAGHRLYRIAADGTVTPLLQHDRAERHALMGIWPAPDGSVYVADYHDRTVNRVFTSGNVALVTKTEPNWFPSAVLRARNGALWLTEYNSNNQVRLKRISPDGKTRFF